MIRVAVVGAGLMGSLHGANFASLSGRARVSRVYDADRARAEMLATRVGALAVADLNDALGAADVDAVAVCIPPYLHRAVVERALAEGKHVFLEKPIATSAADADAIVEAAARSGRFLMVGLVLRFWPGYVELERRVATGELGRPVSVAAYRLQRPPDWGGWIADPRQSGGIAPLVLVHDFDQMNWLLGPPRHVFAQALAGAGPSAPHVVAYVEHELGRGVAEASMTMPPSYPFTSSIRAVCERGALEYAFTVDPPAAEDEGAASAGRFTPTQEPILRVFRAEPPPQEVRLASVDLWRPELEYFVDCIERARAPEQGTPEQAREALAAALAANRSLESGRLEPV